MCPSVARMFVDRATQTPHREAYRFPDAGSWRSLTWLATLERVRAIASGLRVFGLEPGQRVGLLSSTRHEWILADFGVLCSAGATTTVYPSNTAAECAYVLADSEAVMVFAEDDEQVAKLRSHRDQLPLLTKVIVFDGAGDSDWVVALDELEERGREAHKANPDEFMRVVDAIEPQDLATLIYTSGTTGRPKGVRLVHECWTYEAEAVAALDILDKDDIQYLWLPLSHSLGKVLQVAQLSIGFATAIDGRIDLLIDNLSVVRPTFMAAAPRIFEKVYNKVISGAKSAGGVKYALFRWAIRVGGQVSVLRQRGKSPGGILALKHRIADQLVFSKLKARFGGRVRLFISGSAPLTKEIAEFFHSADILVLEGYGLTETSAATFVNRPDQFRFGSVGHPVPGTEVKIAEADGEILVRGPGVMRGYHNLPDETAEVLADDGWLHTGDIGKLDGDGFLWITDRKKDLIKTSGGKYVAPQMLEGRLKLLCPLVSQVVVHGDRRKYVTALITLDEESLQAWANDQGLGGMSYEDLSQSDHVVGMMQSYVDQLNSNLAGHETIKRFALLPRDLSVEGGDLTPSLKVKRKVVEQKYTHMLEQLYEGATAAL